MKNFFLYLIAGACLISQSSSAEYPSDRSTNEPLDRYPGVIYSSEAPSNDACSPQYKKSNLDKLESVLNSVAERPDFANAKEFRLHLQIAQNIQNLDQRIKQYLLLVGVANQEQLADLLGGDHDMLYIAKAKRNLNLSNAQAQTVVNKLSAAFRGGLK